MRRFLAGACGGFALGYTAFRAYEAYRDLKSPGAAIPQDAVRYGGYRRAAMLAGIARSTAMNAAIAFYLADRLPEPLRSTPTWRGTAASYLLSSLVETLLETPVAYVEGFVTERRYGLSDQSAGAWLADRLKGSAVALAIGTPMVTALVATAQRAPRRWPVFAALAIPPLLVLANLLVPVYIAPLFNTFEPVEGGIAERLRALAQRYGVHDPQILCFDMSKQTKKANAYVTGLFNTHRIVLADNLLASFEGDEIEFVVAHELGHYVARDTWTGVAIGSTAGCTLIAAAYALARGRGNGVSSLPQLQRFTFYLSVLATLAGPLIAAGSRALERRADRFAVSATGKPAWGVAAFERLRERNLAEDEQPRWAELLFSSHPSLRSRIAALQAS